MQEENYDIRGSWLQAGTDNTIQKRKDANYSNFSNPLRNGSILPSLQPIFTITHCCFQKPYKLLFNFVKRLISFLSGVNFNSTRWFFPESTFEVCLQKHIDKDTDIRVYTDVLSSLNCNPESKRKSFPCMSLCFLF